MEYVLKLYFVKLNIELFTLWKAIFYFINHRYKKTTIDVNGFTHLFLESY